MGTTGHNSKNATYNNYSALSEYIKSVIKEKKYDIHFYSDNAIEIDFDDCKGNEIAIDIASGDYYDTTSGSNKANQRSYRKIAIPGNDGFMCANYVLMVALGMILDAKDCFDIVFMSCSWHDQLATGLTPVINHLNGDVTINHYDNLEVTNSKYNGIHARVMKELYDAYPEKYVKIRGFDGDKPMYRFTGNNKLTSKMITDFNRHHNWELGTFSRKNNIEYSTNQINEIINYFQFK